MDFHQLLAKMQELDAPVQECGEMPPSPMSPMSSPAPVTPPPAPPSMSVNLNAQGMENIEDLLKLITKVNPDMEPKDAGLPSLSAMPSLTPPGPSIGGLGNLDSGPLKMLPDFDKDNDDMPGGEKDGSKTIDIALGKIGGDDGPETMDKPDDGDDGVSRAQGDLDHDGDHDMDDHDMEKDDGDEKEATDNRDAYQRDFDSSQTGFDRREREDDEGEDEGYANEPDTEVKSVDYMNNQLAGGMNKPKDTFPKVAGGDNPMQKVKEGGDLRAQIRAELLRRLNEAKGAK